MEIQRCYYIYVGNTPFYIKNVAHRKYKRVQLFAACKSEGEPRLQRAHAGDDVKGQHSRDLQKGRVESGDPTSRRRRKQDEDAAMWPSMGRARGTPAGLAPLHSARRRRKRLSLHLLGGVAIAYVTPWLPSAKEGYKTASGHDCRIISSQSVQRRAIIRESLATNPEKWQPVS